MRKRLLLTMLLLGCGARAAVHSTPTEARSSDETHRLIDLFDQARFGRDDAARKELLEALAVPDDANRTNAVLDALLVRLDAVLADDRLDASAQAARTLLELDRKPATARAELFARVGRVKGVARGGGPFAANAILRLWSFCERSLAHAFEEPARARPLLGSMCLYPLYDSDPEPYFDPDPARRPPAPAFADLVAKMHELETNLAAQPSRLAALAPRLRADLDALMKDAEARDLPPRALDPRALGVPPVAEPPLAPPYDGEPLVFVHDPTPAELARFEADLRKLLEIDGRGRAALALRADAAARGFLDLAAILRRLGAGTVELAVGWEQQIKPPAGDYWYGRAGDGRIPRLGVLPLHLDPKSLGSKAGMKLVLTISPRAWRIVSPSGAMPAIPIAADAAPARAALRAQLAQLLDAFPDEGGLAVAPEPTVTAAALATALHAAGRVVGELALTSAPPAAAGDLAARAARRAGVKVTLVPDVLAPRTAAVRRCVQDAQDRPAPPAGNVTLELDAGKAKITGGPGDEPLRACILSRLGPALVSGNVRSARVEISSAPPSR